MIALLTPYLTSDLLSAAIVLAVGVGAFFADRVDDDEWYYATPADHVWDGCTKGRWGVRP